MNKLFGPSHYTEDDLKDEGFRALGRNVRIARNCTIIGAENISIGDNVRIDGYCTLVAAGNGYITLGSYIHIGGNCVLLGGEGIVMEDFSGVSWGVQVFSKSDDFTGRYMTNPTVPSIYTGVKGGKVIFGRHALVGANTIILPKVKLGEGVAVGAQSLVTKSLDEWGVYSGSPVKLIKPRSKRLLSMEKRLLDDINGIECCLSELNKN